MMARRAGRPSFGPTLALVLMGLAVSGSIVATSGVSATGTPTIDVGYLEGQAEIGPLQPVERVGFPPPGPSAEVCAARGLTVYASDGTTEVASFNLQADCTYQVSLPAGWYVVQLKPLGIDFSKDLPREVQVESGQTTRLDIMIDTGIR